MTDVSRPTALPAHIESRSSLPGLTRKSGVPDLRQSHSADLGQARGPVQSIFFARRWMRGSSPIRANLRSSLPGLTRQSIDLRKNFLAKKMDARVKPAHDELAKQLQCARMGSSPRMTASWKIRGFAFY